VLKKIRSNTGAVEWARQFIIECLCKFHENLRVCAQIDIVLCRRGVY
jgi:hypothetical protein